MKKIILLLALGFLCQPLYPQRTEYPQIGAQVFIEPGQTDKQIDGFFRILAQHGFETARIRMFGAHMLRPDGSWDFTLYDKAFDAAGKHGVKLFATLFPPTDELGDVGGFKFPRSKAHLLEIAGYIEAVVSHFRGHPALDTWVLQNEPGTGGTGPGRNDLTDEVFARWKAAQKTPAYDNGYLKADFTQERFHTDFTTWYLGWIASQVDLHDPAHHKHINPHQLLDNLADYDFPAYEGFLTSLGVSMHLSWHFGYFTRAQYPLGISLMADIIRSGAGKNPFWITEMQGGNVTASGREVLCPTAREITQWLWTGIAAGADGVFLADYRYTVPLVLNGSELTLGTIGVGSWDEGAGGTAQGMTPTHYRIEGLENRTIEVYLAGSDSPTQITLDAKGEAMQQAGVPVGIVARIACDGTQYEIGREESSQISLRIVDGKVAFREADDKGFIPVNTIAELKMIDLDNASRGRKYLQQGNIDLLDAEWTPISKLEGIYDGGNFTVARLRVSLGNGNAGLFAANGGTIRNVVIASASALRGQWHAGMVCGENTGTIERCTNRASVTDGGSNTLGGICGYNNNGTISECLNTGTLTIDATVPSDGTGGIVGYCGKGTITGCGNTGGIGGKPSKTGGIAGQADDCQIADCYNTGDLVLPWGAGDNNGGIAGLTYNATLITRCYNTGTVTVEGSQAGGICGQLNAGATISSCYNAGKVGAKWNSGGIAGQSTDAEIIACHNDGLIESQTSGWAGAGGICGFHKGTITACYHIGQVTGDSAIGAIVGEHNSGNISYCYWNGDLEGIPAGGGGSQTGNEKFGAAWPQPSTHEAWRTTAETPAAYWRTLGSAGGGYPKLAWEK